MLNENSLKRRSKPAHMWMQNREKQSGLMLLVYKTDIVEVMSAFANKVLLLINRISMTP
jgi:hypothetical protein